MPQKLNLLAWQQEVGDRAKGRFVFWPFNGGVFDGHCAIGGPQLNLKLKQRGHGIELIKRVRSAYPNIKMLVSSGFEETLTDRELEIFRMVGKGQTSGAIANDPLLSSHTIDTHRETIKRRLGLKNGAELNRQAVQFFLENS